jgi:hypothetical protein
MAGEEMMASPLLLAFEVPAAQMYSGLARQVR